jgi:hypothetical protein
MNAELCLNISLLLKIMKHLLSLVGRPFNKGRYQELLPG